MPTMLLCAGMGTRLRPLSEWCAKAVMPVGDRPALAHMLEQARPAGGPIVVNAHHRADDVREFLAAHAPDAALSFEPDLLGTAGGVAHASDELGPGDVLVWNGDILAEIEVRALLGAHQSPQPTSSQATLGVCPGTAGTGNVGVDASGRVVRLRKETTMAGEVSGGEFVGVHVLGVALRAGLPSRGCLVGDVYLPALRRGATLRAFAVPRWREIGTVDGYLDANVAWVAGRGGSWSAPDARVAPEVELVGCVVGAGAEVGGRGRLERCVVWPGARALAPVADIVIAPGGVARRQDQLRNE
jgi:mannose-1-phosphate guanylyltransferase